MEGNTTKVTGGIGFCGALCIAFIVLKLCKVIDWSWWWVLSPVWIPIAAILAILVIALLTILVCFIARKLV